MMARHQLKHVGTPRPISLPGISAEEATAARQLARNFLPLAIAVGEAKLLVNHSLWSGAATSDPWLTFAFGGDMAAVQLPWSTLAGLAGQPVEGGDVADAALVVEDGISGWLDKLEAEGWPSFRLTEVRNERPNLPIFGTLEVRGQTASGEFFECRAPLALSPGSAKRYSEILAPLATPRPLVRDMPIPIDITIASIALPQSALDRLQIGDGVRLPLDGPAIATLPGGATAPAKTADAGFELCAPFQPMLSKASGDLVMDNQSTDQSASDNGAANATTDTEEENGTASAPTPDGPAILPSAVDVALTFHAGGTQITLAELETLAPGSILPTHAAADTSVEIRANGHTIGRGELMQLDSGRVVRVTSLAT